MMAITDNNAEPVESFDDPNSQIDFFEVKGLFGYLDHKVFVPQLSESAIAPGVAIIEGENGTGKTTILKMISGIVNGLDFDPFRVVPFSSATLQLTNGHFIRVEYDAENPSFPIKVSNPNQTVNLIADRSAGQVYEPAQYELVEAFRKESLPVLRGLVFNLITIDRSLENDSDDDTETLRLDARTGRLVKKGPNVRTLAHSVRSFLRDAQVNYRRFFQAEQLELLPRLLKSFENIEAGIDPQKLQMRIKALRTRNAEIARFGLQTDERELQTLHELLSSSHIHDPHSLSALASYVEIHESRSEARDLIATRLALFETIMDEFLVGKEVRINNRTGLDITSKVGKLGERDLSSGEFHFLFMMVAALLCKRAGTILAIDEPELSLHVKWQRKIVSALSKCASGAAPIFLLATHSTAISAAHSESVQRLSAIE